MHLNCKNYTMPITWHLCLDQHLFHPLIYYYFGHEKAAWYTRSLTPHTALSYNLDICCRQPFPTSTYVQGQSCTWVKRTCIMHTGRKVHELVYKLTPMFTNMHNPSTQMCRCWNALINITICKFMQAGNCGTLENWYANRQKNSWTITGHIGSPCRRVDLGGVCALSVQSTRKT